MADEDVIKGPATAGHHLGVHALHECNSIVNRSTQIWQETGAADDFVNSLHMLMSLMTLIRFSLACYPTGDKDNESGLLAQFFDPTGVVVTPNGDVLVTEGSINKVGEARQTYGAVYNAASTGQPVSGLELPLHSAPLHIILTHVQV